MPLSPSIAVAGLLPHLQLLCKEPSVAGHQRALDEGAQIVTSVLRGYGLNCEIVPTGGAPVVIGRYDAGVSRTLLLYCHYDVAPQGPRRSWSGDPYQLVERDATLYARGVIAKGEIIARAAALNALIEAGTLPFNICMVVEGEYHVGSPNLGAVIPHLPSAEALLWSGGTLDAEGIPLLYTGTKGLLQVELRADSSNQPVPLTYAATSPNPIWTLIWSLASLKSEFEEVLPEGFYDDVQPPTRAIMTSIQGIDIGEEARRSAWNINRFVANMSGVMLLRTESFSPTCNISRFDVQGSDIPSVPSRATATVQLQLVPDQQPDAVWEQVKAHFEQRETPGLRLTRLGGSYAPHTSQPNTPWSAAAAAASSGIYPTPGHLIASAPFAAPASILAPDVPLVSAGLERPTSSLFGPDEQLPLADLERHTQFIAEWIAHAATV